jgi:uncharacterized protein (DUF433 family)
MASGLLPDILVAACGLCYYQRQEANGMQVEDYFDFQAQNDIRVKGTRVGIETILYDLIHRSRTPDEIVASYPSLNLEQIYATILYYLSNKDKVTAYLVEWLETGHKRWEEQHRNPTPAVQRLRRIAAERREGQTYKP